VLGCLVKDIPYIVGGGVLVGLLLGLFGGPWSGVLRPTLRKRWLARRDEHGAWQAWLRDSVQLMALVMVVFLFLGAIWCWRMAS
jgi:hypothetical protein